MSSNRTAGPNSGRWGSLLKGLPVLIVSAGVLGAHHNTKRAAESIAPSLIRHQAVLLEGAGESSATRAGWSPARAFHLVPASAWGGFAALDSGQRLTIYKINRMDGAHAARRWLLVPDSIGAELSYSPLPDTIPALVEIPKMVLVSRRVQAFGAYEHGVLVRWGPTSTGKLTTPTDTGLFFTNWKSRTAISTDDPSWILDWYVNIIALKGVAFHQYDLPGRPASHGCVRLLEEDAYWIYRWTDEWIPGRGSEVKRYGTPVLIFGDWDASQAAPWFGLITNEARATVSSWEVSAALGPERELLFARVSPPPPLLAMR